MKRNIFIMLLSVWITDMALSQSTTASNLGFANRYLGFSNNVGLSVRTANTTRMWINPIGTNFSGINTSGYWHWK